MVEEKAKVSTGRGCCYGKLSFYFVFNLGREEANVLGFPTSGQSLSPSLCLPWVRAVLPNPETSSKYILLENMLAGEEGA